MARCVLSAVVMSTFERLAATFFEPIDEAWEPPLAPVLQLVSSQAGPPGDHEAARARARRRARRRLRRRRLMVILVEEVGLEPQHLAQLRWRDVELAKQLLWIPTPLGAGRRRLALTKAAHLLLERTFRRTRDPLGFVFPRRGSDRSLSVDAVRRILGTVREVDHG